MKRLIKSDKQGLLNIEYEIHSGCGARKKIRSVSLRSAKSQATRLGFGTRFTVWIRELKTGKLVSSKKSNSNSLWN